MAHLKPHEFAELLDGELSAARRAHVEDCEPCRAQADDVREALRQASAAHVPEPSPLFWEHFSSRVREAIDAAPVENPRTAWLRHPATAWAVSALVATLVLAVVFARALLPRDTPRLQPEMQTAAAPRSTPATLSAPASALDRDIEEDGAWALVRVVAEDVAWEEAEAAGLGAVPGDAEDLALELSATERAELAQLIETELKQRGV